MEFLSKPFLICLSCLFILSGLAWAEHKQVALERVKTAQALSAMDQAITTLKDSQKRDTAASDAFLRHSTTVTKKDEVQHGKLQEAVRTPEGKAWAEQPIPSDIAGLLSDGGLCIGEACPSDSDTSSVPDAGLSSAGGKDHQ